MTTIAEYLSHIRAGCPERGSPLASMRVGTLHELGSALEAWAKESAGHGWLYSLMVQLSGGSPVHPDTVAEVLHMIGVDPSDTLEQVGRLAGSISVIAQRYQALMRSPAVPVLPRGDMIPVDNQRALDILRHHCRCADDMQVWTHDMGPQAITREMLGSIVRANLTAGLTYRYPGADCDDFACYLRAALAMVGCGDVLGIVRIVNVKPDGTAISGHVINCAWLTDGTIQLIEPQGCKLVPPDYAIDGGTSNIITGVIL